VGSIFSHDSYKFSHESYKRQQPKTLKVNAAIKAFTEALQLMPVGSKWELVVPASLAYGESGTGPVGPNATLKYELELLSISR
jgi:FKBP-type peptidyl-prolyl cis-trans isomerase FklB